MADFSHPAAPFDPELARLVVNSALDFAIVVSDVDGIITGWNPGAEKLLGWPASEAVGQHMRLMFLPHDREANSPEGEMLHATAEGRSINERWHGRKDGSIFWGSGLLMPLRQTADGPITGFVKMMRDRTVERDAERRFQALTDALPGFVFVTDAEGHNAQVNAAYRLYTGRPLEALLGDRWLDVVHPDDRDDVRTSWMQSVGGSDTYERRLRFRRGDGAYRYFDCRVIAQRDDAGNTLQWIGTCIDVDNEAQARDALEHMNRNLEQEVTARTSELEMQMSGRLRAEEALRQSQKMEAIGQLTGGVAHDFNNLLTVIRSSADLLRRPDLPDEKRRRYIDGIAETADRGAKLTRQLLAFARRETLKPVRFDVRDQVRGVLDLLRTSLGGKIDIQVDFRCGPCPVEADPVQFDTALVNMAVNARDAMQGEGTLTLTVDSVDGLPAVRGHNGTRGDFVAVSVGDSGHGIPPEHLARIFEPFFTTKEVGKGTGLGLSQVFGFAKQSGGEVDVSSSPGGGSTFTLYLPHAAVAALDTTGTGSAGAVDGDRDRLNLLVVEDNQMVGEFAAQLLQELGHATTWASNAAAALELLGERAADFDVVFTDVVMPGMSGLDLAGTVRRRWPELPVVLTSGYSHVLAEEGTHGFELLRKPYSADALDAVLTRAASRAA